MADVRAAQRRYLEHCRQRFARAVDSFERDIRAQLPVGETGQLRDTFTVQITSGGEDRFVAEASLPVFYAEMLDEGTRPHVIVPRNAKVLVFNVGGDTVFARRVNHPGFPSQEIWKKPAPIIWQSSLEDAFR